MAYKFQLGQARLSGSVIQEGDVTAESSQLNASTLDLADASGIAGAGMEDQSGDLGIAALGVTNAMLAGSIAEGKLAGSIPDSKLLQISTAGKVALSALEIDGESAAVTALADADLLIVDDGADGSNSKMAASVIGDYARGKVSATDAGGDGSFAYNSSTGVFTYTGPSASEVRAHVSVTDAGGDGSLAYDSGTGVITYTGPSAAEVRAHLSGGEMIDFASGEMAINASEFSASTLEVIDANPQSVRDHLSAVISNSVNMAFGSGNGQISADVFVDADALEVTADGVSLKSTIAGSRTFSGDVEIAGGLNVQGSLTYIETTNLAISDALITIGSGSSAFAADYGMEFGAVDGGWASLKTAADIDAGAATVPGFEFSHPVKASRFYGELVGSMVETVQTLTAAAAIDAGNGAQILLDHATAQTFSLPAAANMEGLVLKIKRIGSGESTIEPAGSEELEGGASIKLESQGAAVSIISDGTNYYVI